VNSRQCTVDNAAVRTRFRVGRASVLFTVYCLLFTSLAGCGGGGIRRKVESGIAKALQQRLGPAKAYSVKVTGSTMSILGGKLDGVDISGEDVRLAKGITVARLDVSIKDLAVDTSTQAIKRCKSTTYSAAVSEDELERYVVKRYPDIPGLTLALLKDQARVTASPGVAGVTVSIVAEAALGVRGGRQLVLDLKNINVEWLPTPGFAREYIEGRVNPVFDAADLGFDARIDSVSIAPGFVTLTGTLDLVKALGTETPGDHGTTAGTEPRNL